MNAAAWVGSATGAGLFLVALVTLGVRLIAAVTRAVDSVRDLNESVKEVIEHVASHETRITKLEARLLVVFPAFGQPLG